MSTNHIKKNKKMNKQKRMTKTKRNRKSKNRKNIKYISKKVMKGGSICDLFTGKSSSASASIPSLGAASSATSKEPIPIVKSTKSNSSVTPCISLELNSNFFKVDADLIVNGANSNLILGGGTAGAIAAEDNGTVQTECNYYISVNGPVPTGSSMITKGPSDYPSIKYIAHAVAPKGTPKSTPTKETIEQMKSVVKDILDKASSLSEVNKIAIPPIGTGIFGFDFETAVKIYFEETIDFIIKGKTGNLKEICFVDITKNVYQNDIWNTEFAKIHPQFKCKK